ncbi:hypothetical protein [Streptomyces sp. NPDC057438]|uniref:hypothetical protein n=1 Tax=Streptomyces sp. NPDC057438 TaxID=3346133 RepID=UPI0036840B00
MRDIDSHRNTEGVVMAEQVTPATAETAASCCGTAPARPVAETVPTRSSPCCGTDKDTEAAGSCCAPEAKREAVATGAGCC